MQDVSIRITHRTESTNGAVEHTFDIEASAKPHQTEWISGQLDAIAEPIRTSAQSATGERFERVFAGAAQHVAVIDHQTGLMWSVESLGDPKDADDGICQQACADRCEQLTLLGHTDWRLPTRAELVTLIDDTRHEPAIDVALFPGVKPRWHWTSTPAAWSSASAWDVYFGVGYVYSGLRGSGGFALAVRRAGQ